MLLRRTPSPPKRMAGRTMAYETPLSARARSTSALPRKYGKGELLLGCVMLTCTIRCYPGPLGGLEERPRVGDGQVVIDAASAEAHPIGVVERRRPRERRHETQVVVEVQRPHVDRGRRGGPSGVPGEGTHLAARREQGAGQGGTGVAEGSGDDVESRIGRTACWRDLRGDGVGHGCLVAAGGANVSSRPARFLAWAKRTSALARSPSRWVSISSPRYRATIP